MCFPLAITGHLNRRIGGLRLIISNNISILIRKEILFCHATVGEPSEPRFSSPGSDPCCIYYVGQTGGNGDNRLKGDSFGRMLDLMSWDWGKPLVNGSTATLTTFCEAFLAIVRGPIKYLGSAFATWAAFVHICLPDLRSGNPQLSNWVSMIPTSARLGTPAGINVLRYFVSTIWILLLFVIQGFVTYVELWFLRPELWPASIAMSDRRVCTLNFKSR